MSNVVLLMSDEHNPFFSTPYGHPTVRTPNMARLADRGTVYQNAYCPSPLCLPCRSAFMSGRRVHEIDAYNNCLLELDASIPTYGRVLKEQGVETIHIGKTHVFADGEDLGFSEISHQEDTYWVWPGDPYFRRRPFTVREGAHARADGYGPRAADKSHQGADEGCVSEAVRWLKERGPHMESPWVLTVNVLSPHFPHVVSQPYWDLYGDAVDLPEYGVEQETARHPYARDLRRHFETQEFTEEQVRGLRRGYLACVSFVDDQLGRLMAAMEAAGLTDTTNLIYTSDHGEMLGRFGMWWKCSLLEDSVRVPLIAAGPDYDSVGRVTTAVDLLDLQAAIFHSVGGERPAQWAGTPLQEIKPSDPRRAIFSEYHGHGTRSGGFMIRRGDWKLHYYIEAPNMLFNLRDDPHELVNLVESEQAMARELEEELRAVCDPEEVSDQAFRFEERQYRALKALQREGNGE